MADRADAAWRQYKKDMQAQECRYLLGYREFESYHHYLRKHP